MSRTLPIASGDGAHAGSGRHIVLIPLHPSETAEDIELWRMASA